MNTNIRNRVRDSVLIMRTKDGWYPIEAAGKKPLKDEAQDHGMLNAHVTSVEDIDGNTLWRKQ